MLFRNRFSLDPLFQINLLDLTSYKSLKYNTLIPIVNNEDIVHKNYVDESISNYFPNKLVNANSSIEV